MTDKIRGQVNATVFGASRIFGSARSTFIPWDLSSNPKDNKDRKKKLGSGDATHCGAYIKFDATTHASTMAEGFTDPKKANSWWLPEPDNWILRLHEEAGRKTDNVWALRLIAEHSNESDERTHRGTQVIDAYEKQTWAWTMDAWWVGDLGASLAHKELHVNDAGFLEMLTDKPAGNNSRGVLCGNIAQNAGYLTDGELISQWWHILSPVKVPVTRTGGAPNATTENCLRSDVYYNTGRRRWMLNPKGDVITVDERGAKVAVGQMFLVPPWDPTTKPLIEKPPLEPATDPKSNQPIIQRGTAWKTKVYVLYDQPAVPPKHQYPPTQTTTGHGVNPYAAPVPTGEGSGLQPVPTVDTTHGPTSIAHAFLPGDFTSIEVKFPVPSSIGSNMWAEILMEFSVRAAHAGAQTSDTSFMYRVTAPGAVPGAYTQVDKSFALADGLTAGEWTHCRLTIPHSAFVGKESGILELWVAMRSSSTGPQLILGEFHGKFPDYGTAPTSGFAIL